MVDSRVELVRNKLRMYMVYKDLLKELKRELDQSYYLASGAGSIDYSKPVAGRVSSKGDAPNRITATADSRAKLIKRIESMESEMNWCEKVINELPDSEGKDILSKRYLRGWQWEKLSQHFYCSISSCQRKADSALLVIYAINIK